ncbi:MAG: hypothetical protein V5A57_00800 [Candidatus Paceibacterota bacterium]
MKKILVCDLDGTLVDYAVVRKIPWHPLRITCLGIITWLFSFLQVRWGKPTQTYKKIKELEIDFVVISGRTHFLKEPYRTINELLNLNLEKDDILLRDGKHNFFERGPNRFEHKEKAIADLQEEHEVIAVVEDEPKARRILKKKFNIPIIPPSPKKIEELQ